MEVEAEEELDALQLNAFAIDFLDRQFILPSAACCISSNRHCTRGSSVEHGSNATWLLQDPGVKFFTTYLQHSTLAASIPSVR